MKILVFLLSNNDEDMDRVNKMTFVDVFIVINFLEFFNANDFEEGVGQSERRCIWCVGHNAHHTKFIQNSHQFHLEGIWGVSSSYGPHHCSSHMNYIFFFLSIFWFQKIGECFQKYLIGKIVVQIHKISKKKSIKNNCTCEVHDVFGYLCNLMFE